MSRRRSELLGFVCEALQQKLGASSIFNPDTFLFKKRKKGKMLPPFSLPYFFNRDPCLI
jgi:hypothetical protein